MAMRHLAVLALLGTCMAAPAIPTLEDFVSTWQTFLPDDLAPRHALGLPTANSLVGSIIADENVFATRSGTFPPYTQGPYSPVQRNRSHFGRLLVDSAPLDTAYYQWTPYSFRRRDVLQNVVTEVRLAFTEPIIYARASIADAGTVSLDLFPEFRRYNNPNCTHWDFPNDMESDPPCWNWYAPRPYLNQSSDFMLLFHDAPSGLIVVGDRLSSAITVVALSHESTPNSAFNVQPGGATVDWKLSPTGAPLLIEYVALVGDRNDQGTLVRKALQIASAFSTAFDMAITARQQQFADALTPNNARYSGHLPILDTTDADVASVYYMSVVSVLALERVGLPAANCNNSHNRVFLTGGAENATTNIFFWDNAYLSTLLVMLDPDTVFCTLRICYRQAVGGYDPTAGWGYDWESGHAVGAWYAANDMSLFKLAVYYVTITGNFKFLDEIIDGVTVIDQLMYYATYWKSLVTPGATLADYGGAHNLLECVPSYIHQVASFNAADVWMMRVMARLYSSRGNSTAAHQLAQDADALARAVQTLYVPGQGVWIARYPNGSSTVVRHVIDLVYVSEFMHSDLSPQQSREMLHFATTELLTPHWMRAQSLLDPYANYSDRSDHGPWGAYDGWPSCTINTFAREGNITAAENFLRATAIVTTLGPYGQAHAVRPPLLPYKPFVYTLFNELSGGGFADAIITSVFGLQPGEASLAELQEPPLLSQKTPRTIVGTLHNVPWQGQLYTATSGPSGVSWARAH